MSPCVSTVRLQLWCQTMTPSPVSVGTWSAAVNDTIMVTTSLNGYKLRTVSRVSTISNTSSSSVVHQISLTNWAAWGEQGPVLGHTPLTPLHLHTGWPGLTIMQHNYPSFATLSSIPGHLPAQLCLKAISLLAWAKVPGNQFKCGSRHGRGYLQL